jgi:hypothetical protein
MGIRRPVRNAFAVAAMVAALTGCDVVDTFKEGLSNAAAVDTALEQAIGLKPTTGFNIKNNSLVVTVMFPRPYDAKPLAELGETVRGAVVKEFRKKPNGIVLSFVLSQQ